MIGEAGSLRGSESKGIRPNAEEEQPPDLVPMP